jgi:hypothetical protein
MDINKTNPFLDENTLTARGKIFGQNVFSQSHADLAGNIPQHSLQIIETACWVLYRIIQIF